MSFRSSARTALQRDADAADRELYSVICRVERLYDSIKHHSGPRVADLHKSLQGLRNARAGVRMLMDDDDRARTS
jgi:hypothetical protein